MTNLNNEQNFQYSIEHIDFNKVKSVKDVLLLLKEHDYNSLVYAFRAAAIGYAIVYEYGERDEKKLELAFTSILTHDTGKLGMPPEFINYEGVYTTAMFKEMNKHPHGGAFILEKVNAAVELIEVALYHHRNYDRTGYGGELKEGEEIPYLALVARIADSVDAYMTKRCYKEGGPAFGVYLDLKQFVGKSYDPVWLETFREVHEKVMERCHILGEDNPSQDFYMNELMEIYLNKFPAKTIEEALELF